MSIRIEKKVDIGTGSPVIVFELTVAQVRAWLKEFESQDQQREPPPESVDVVGDALFAECALSDLARMCSMGVHELSDLTESQVAAIIDAAKELNPRFFGLRARLYAAAEKALQRVLPV